jgi:hypothetical protein
VKEKVAVATVVGKAYFLIVNELREQGVPFISLVPGEAVPAEAKVVITTERENQLIKHEKILTFKSESELDSLVNEAKRILQGKEVYEKIVIGIDPGEAMGLAVIADGKVIEERTCFSAQEIVGSIIKRIRNVSFLSTDVSVRIGNGVSRYQELLRVLDDALPHQVTLEVVGEAGTNRSLKENKHSRGIRHISSAIRIAGRTGYIFPRRNDVAKAIRVPIEQF